MIEEAAMEVAEAATTTAMTGLPATGDRDPRWPPETTTDARTDTSHPEVAGVIFQSNSFVNIVPEEGNECISQGYIHFATSSKRAAHHI